MVSSKLPCSAGKGLEHPTIVPLSVPLSSGHLRKSSSVAVRIGGLRTPHRGHSTPGSQFFSSPLASCHASFRNPAYLFIEPMVKGAEYNYQSELPIYLCAQHSHHFPLRGRTVRPRTCYSQKASTQIPANFGSTYCNAQAEQKWLSGPVQSI